MHQWWLFKRENMDTVLFFKVGKFYELFHMDADVGMRELDLIYMKGRRHIAASRDIIWQDGCNTM